MSILSDSLNQSTLKRFKLKQKSFVFISYLKCRICFCFHIIRHSLIKYKKPMPYMMLNAILFDKTITAEEPKLRVDTNIVFRFALIGFPCFSFFVHANGKKANERER